MYVLCPVLYLFPIQLILCEYATMIVEINYRTYRQSESSR